MFRITSEGADVRYPKTRALVINGSLVLDKIIKTGLNWTTRPYARVQTDLRRDVLPCTEGVCNLTSTSWSPRTILLQAATVPRANLDVSPPCYKQHLLRASFHRRAETHTHLVSYQSAYAENNISEIWVKSFRMALQATQWAGTWVWLLPWGKCSPPCFHPGCKCRDVRTGNGAPTRGAFCTLLKLLLSSYAVITFPTVTSAAHLNIQAESDPSPEATFVSNR